MDQSLPNAKSARSPTERENLLRLISQRGLAGLANDTKWNELISAMRTRVDWQPSYRYKSIDGPVSNWDVEWFYHLPFPMLSVEWLDIGHLQQVIAPRLPRRIEIVDHSSWIEPLLKRIGLDHCKGQSMIRVFGYSPRSVELLDEEPGQ